MNILITAVAALLIIATAVLIWTISVLAGPASRQHGRHAAGAQIREDTDGTRYTVTYAGDHPPATTAASLATLTRIRDRLRDLPAAGTVTS